jgi:UDP-N-acetylglucosamine pyrophosphorylase
MNSSDALLNQAVAANELKMLASGATPNCITAFLHALQRLQDDGAGFVPEATIQPVASLPSGADLPAKGNPQLLQHLVVIKLNGGLGTKMGLDFAKSLIRVKGQDTFLDFIARQIIYLRQQHGTTRPVFLLMNSFRTQQDTLQHLARYPELSNPGLPLDLLQSKVPKIDPATFLPVSYPADPELEWCPPGHGDLYPSLADTGLLDQLLDQGIEFAFVSNSDNLAATVDLPLLDYFAQSGCGFLMEVAERTEMDRKGGHLAQRRSDGRLVLREVAQCPEPDRAHFEGSRHRYFNTNNLWLRLSELRRILPRLSLPIIKNLKPVNPQDPTSQRVLQLETAMGAAIECFDRAGAILVPRSRFSPVKDTADLLALRSDAFEVTEDFRLSLAHRRAGRPPIIKLDPAYFTQLTDFESCFAAGTPSLIDCEELAIEGPWQFSSDVICQGRVHFLNRTPDPKTAPAGRYAGQVLTAQPQD